MKEIKTRITTFRDKLLLRVPDRLSRFEERYGAHPQKEIGIKDIYKNGLHIRRAFTSDLWSSKPRQYVEDEFTPSFAVGKCIDISDGDYKTVMIDYDGHSDYVIKRFGWANIYRGEDAKQKAEKAARQIAAIYKVIDETSGFHIIPNEVFAFPYSDAYPNAVTVYEKQQRGIFVDHWSIFEPHEARRIDQAIEEGIKRYHKVTVPTLLKRGLVTPNVFNPTQIADHITLYVSWDLISNLLVARDVVDAVYER